jgi:hypothetical protein
MSQPPQDPSWLPWLGAIVPVVLAIGAFMRRFFASVTRAELREAIQDSQRIIDQRHGENLERMAAQDRELREIRSAVGRIEGQISGRYPKVQGP